MKKILKEINIKILINDEGEILSAVTCKNFDKDAFKRIQLAGVYAYLMNKELNKINIESRIFKRDENE